MSRMFRNAPTHTQAHRPTAVAISSAAPFRIETVILWSVIVIAMVMGISRVFAAPFTGTPYSVPGTIEAENFDTGGQGVGYNDKTNNNQGGQYRTKEGVDIIVSPDSAGGGYVINNFQTGEWLAYTINVTSSGPYDIMLRASSTS